jgi:uncharacterized membrane protein
MHGEDWVGRIREWIEWAALGIELLGALVIVAGVLRVAITRGTVRFLMKLDEPGAGTAPPGGADAAGPPRGSSGPAEPDPLESYKHQMGRSLLLGLEFLVAGDVVRTVALEPTLTNVAVLGLLVLVRTFLSWTLAVEIEGRWPWQPKARPATRGSTRSDEG